MNPLGLWVAFFAAVATVSGIGARLVVIKVNTYAMAVFGYKATAILFTPWIENGWMLLVAWATLGSYHHPWFPLAVIGSITGFAIQERFLFWPEIVTLTSLRWVHLAQFWAFGPLALLVGGVVFLIWCRRNQSHVGFWLWGIWHGAWNMYWMS